MKVLKVIVDEMPKSCVQCQFLNKIYCSLEDDRFVGKFPEPTPDWCPLMVLQENERIGVFRFVGKGEAYLNTDDILIESEKK